jgi:PPOX class probable F420-dependent enzyme
VADVDPQTARDRVAGAAVGHLATVRADGRPHVVPCCFALAGEWLYSAVDGKPKTTMALRRLENITAQPAVSLLVDRYDEDWADLWWVRVDGRAEVWEAGPRYERAVAALVAKYRQYREAAPTGAVIAVRISGWRWWP